MSIMYVELLHYQITSAKFYSIGNLATCIEHIKLNFFIYVCVVANRSSNSDDGCGARMTSY